MYLGKPKTDSNIAWHRPMSADARQEEELIQKSLRALSSTTDPLDKLHLLCFSHGSTGIMALGRVFRKIDDGSKQLTVEKVIDGFKKAGIHLSNKEVEELFDRFDTDKTGLINLDEFLIQIRPSMSETRRSILEQAFKKLDKAGEGDITIDAIRQLYSGSTQPRYRSGEEYSDIILNRFLEHFETQGTADGKITFEEFMNYYSGISISIESDCYFDLIIRQAYLL